MCFIVPVKDDLLSLVGDSTSMFEFEVFVRASEGRSPRILLGDVFFSILSIGSRGF